MAWSTGARVMCDHRWCGVAPFDVRIMMGCEGIEQDCGWSIDHCILCCPWEFVGWCRHVSRWHLLLVVPLALLQQQERWMSAALESVMALISDHSTHRPAPTVADNQQSVGTVTHMGLCTENRPPTQLCHPHHPCSRNSASLVVFCCTPTMPRLLRQQSWI